MVTCFIPLITAHSTSQYIIFLLLRPFSHFSSTESLRYRDGTPYSHTQLKPITASVSLPVSDSSRGNAPRVTSSLPHVTSSNSHVTSSAGNPLPLPPKRNCKTVSRDPDIPPGAIQNKSVTACSKHRCSEQV